ncbi:DNA-binding transcription factor cat8 [Recurvomyces mirabilis]|nr:DNA-binding transcription factor cat8 [Recurvomyces mirabilis]
MPGILPMKVIKVGTNAQTRIAQACDRCRSKKIRCDGIRPCCTQCANVGFECKTSDKLSRRAFPRGYTESLEERVRGLENEVRELKELLDEKDEKIDMLTRIHSNSSLQLPCSRRPSRTSVDSGSANVETPEKDEVFKVQQSPYLLAGAVNGGDSYFSGTSSSRTFIEAFKHKVQETGRSTADICTDALLASKFKNSAESSPSPSAPVVWKAPPRLVSDQLVNIFFQEWAPLYPVLHRPTFLNLYEKYVADADAVTDKTAIAQLNLVFGISALSNGSRASDDLESFEGQWKAAIDAILNENTMGTLQALVLAQIYCVQQGDLTRLLTYKGLSTTLSARLGLHQSQKRFALGTLTCETRKKVFWTLYAVDSFTAVTLGLPKQLKDDDVHCEYPVDADDEYVTERGFQPTLPGESTKLSSALALFRAARILSRVLEEVFPAKTSYDLSMKKLGELSDELDAWSSSLAPHLRLQFAQDKPSTGTISSRSPLLSMTYHYIRALIHRPAASASTGSSLSSSKMTLASSCKHIVQLVQLLEERAMCFAFCLNKDELLVLSGFGLLFQGLDLDPASKILKDNHKTVLRIISVLDKSKAPCAMDFGRVARSFLPAAPAVVATKPTIQPASTKRVLSTPKESVPTLSRHNSDSAAVTINPIPSLPASTRRQLKAIASRFTMKGSSSTSTKMDPPSDHRRATVHNISLHPNAFLTQSQPSLSPPMPAAAYQPSSLSRSEPSRSPSNTYGRPASMLERPSAPPSVDKTRPASQQHMQPPQQKPKSKLQQKPSRHPNLDYLSFGPESENRARVANSTNSVPIKSEPSPTDWEKLLGSLDNGQTNIYDACYGGQPIEALLDTAHHNTTSMTAHATAIQAATATQAAVAASASWDADLWSLYQTDTNTSDLSALTNSNASGQAESLFSFTSDEDGARLVPSPPQKDDLVGGTWPGSVDGSTDDLYKGICVPADLLAHGEELDFGAAGGSWDEGLGLGL